MVGVRLSAARAAIVFGSSLPFQALREELESGGGSDDQR
jgi:hypothetical protein